jgi:hypothetical protein
MDFIKPEPDTDGEAFLTFSCNESQLIEVKQDEDPLLIRFPLKTDNEVSYLSICPLLSTCNSEVSGHFFGMDC